jgi:hypothetical protein
MTEWSLDLTRLKPLAAGDLVECFDPSTWAKLRTPVMLPPAG